MIRSSLHALALLLALAAPSLAGDLSGLWAVEGSLPDGRPFSGHAVLAPQQDPGQYTLNAVAEVEGEQVRWQATASRQQDQLTTRHWRPGKGLAGVIAGDDAQGVRVLGSYTIQRQAGVEVALQGSFGAEGGAQGSATYSRLADPEVRFDPPALTVHPGETTQVHLRTEPPGLGGLLWIQAPADWVEWSRRGDLLTIKALRPGFRGFTAQLGRGGTALAELELEVQSDVLQRVLERVKAEANDGDGRVPIVIFDLDDTLFDTRYRTLQILHEYAEAEHEERLNTVQPEQIHYELQDTIHELGYSEPELAQLMQPLRRFWLKRFFSDDRLKDDRAYDGAPAYLHALVEAGAQIAYVTGRKVTAREASRAKLVADGYPVEGQHLFLKPIQVPGKPKLETEVFKGQVASQELPKLGEPVAAFDNDPENCNAFLENLPEGSIVVFLDTLYSPTSPPVNEGVERVISDAYDR